MKEGSCVECKSPTDWNEGTQKYERYCKNPACKQKYIQRAKSRMVTKYGKEHILDDPDVQRRMQASKKISGKYRFEDGGVVEFVGSYEEAFLMMLDNFGFSSNDIIGPSPNTYYYDYVNENDKENEGRKFYIPDFFIPSLNLEVEIKTQLNTHHKIQAVDKVKEKLKDEMMASIPNISYLKLSDKDYTSFFKLLLDIREKSADTTSKKYIRPAMEEININSDTEKLDFGLEQAVTDYPELRDGKLSIFDSTKICKYIEMEGMMVRTATDGYVNDESPVSGNKAVYVVLLNIHDSKIHVNRLDTNVSNHIGISFNHLLNPIYVFTDRKYGELDAGEDIGIVEIDRSDVVADKEHRIAYIVCGNMVNSAVWKALHDKITFAGSSKGVSKSIEWLQLTPSVYELYSEESREDFCTRYISCVSNITDIPQLKFFASGSDLKSLDINSLKHKMAECSVNHDLAEIIPDVATEAVSLSTAIGFWRQKLFPEAFVGSTVAPTRYVTLNKVIIDEKRQVISIQNINQKLLLSRIQSLYGDKKVKFIFECMYSRSSIAKFNRKKLKRSQMTITALETPLFFALELSVLFMELYEQYREPAYKSIANTIYSNSWIKNCDNVDASRLNTDNLNSVFHEDYKPKPHQKEFVEIYPSLKARLNLNGYLLAFDQGLGKTITAVALSTCLVAQKTYIICPKSVCAVWKQEISSYMKVYHDNPVLRDKEVIICDSKKTPSADDVANAKFIITNNENIKAIHPYIVTNVKTMMIVDEIHNFRNNKGTRTTEIINFKEVLKPKDILLMSGTPIKAAPAEIVPALRLLDPLFTPQAAEIYTKCFDLDTTMAMSMVKKRFGYIMYRKTKEILDLPNKYTMDLRMDIKDPSRYFMSNVQKEVADLFNQYYQEELKKNLEFRAQFEQMVSKYSTSSEMQKSMYMKWLLTINTIKTMNLHELDYEFMITYLEKYVYPNISNKYELEQLKVLEKKFIHMKRSCLSRATGKIYPPRRTELFISLFEENKKHFISMIENNTKKTVIFSQCLGVIHYMSDALTAEGIENVKIVGGDTKGRIDLINKFRNDDNVMVLLATSQTLSMGVTLVEANQMFFFGPPWRSTDYNQCCDRIYRIGQTSDVSIYNVILNSKEFNLSDKMNKILNWSSDMFGAAVDDLENSSNEMSVAEESIIFSKEPDKFNMENIDRRKGHNIIWVTGLSGSGKSTLAGELVDEYEPAIHIELDVIENNRNLFEWGTEPMPTGYKITKQWFIDTYGGKKDFDCSTNDGKKEFIAALDAFINYIKGYASTHTGMIFIIEGVQIAFDHSVWVEDDDPVIIVNTSFLKSQYRKSKRDDANIFTGRAFNMELHSVIKDMKKRFKG